MISIRALIDTPNGLDQIDLKYLVLTRIRSCDDAYQGRYETSVTRH